MCTNLPEETGTITREKEDSGKKKYHLSPPWSDYTLCGLPLQKGETTGVGNLLILRQSIDCQECLMKSGSYFK